MIKLYDEGIYLVNGKEIVKESEAGKVEQLTGKPADKTEARKGTISYGILEAHNQSDSMDKLKIKFDELTSHDITYVKNLKKIDRTELIYKREMTHRLR